jgi:catechol 2,3-dioxygenase-like lactoylglutathione lyase family enzyme
MGKLRHIAIAVANTEETAKFYEQAFGMTRVRQSSSSVPNFDPRFIHFVFVAVGLISIIPLF